MSDKQDIPPVGAVANWFGSNRMLAHRAAELMGKQDMIAVPFAGGMTELPYFQCRSILVNDLHRAVINTASVMGDDVLGPKLYRKLRRTIFHPDQLKASQSYCESIYPDESPSMFDMTKIKIADPVEWAYHYFISSWMSRAGSSGTDREFKAGYSVRYEASGGDSAKRFVSAARGIPIWRRTLRKCVFSTLDAFEFFRKVKDQAGTGYYADPPFPSVGDKYAHKFNLSDHERLRDALKFEFSKVVIRYYATPLIEQLYSGDGWTIHRFEGRTQTNDSAPEILITRN